MKDNHIRLASFYLEMGKKKSVKTIGTPATITLQHGKKSTTEPCYIY